MLMGSAHHLTKANSRPWFNENRSKGFWRYEAGTQLRRKLLTFNSALTLSRHGWVMGSANHITEMEYLTKVRGKRDMGRTQN